MAANVGTATGYLDIDVNGFMTGLKTAEAGANTAFQNMEQRIGSKLTGIGNKISSAGKTWTVGVTTPIVGLGAAAVKVTADFDSAMSKVSAISGATGEDLDKLNAKAQEMGAKTKFSATESAEAFTYMAMAGWKTEEMLDGIDGIMNLAAADGLDLATTSDIVTDALTAFGMSAGDSARFADVLAAASSNANTNVSMLGESFKYVAPVAGALGFSAEDTAIALGLMANAGIKGSQSGTALRASLTRMIKPTDDAAALMEEYGISMTNADGTMKSLGEVMDTLRSSLGGLTEAEQAEVAANIFGQEAMSGMLAIINASDADYQKLTESIYGADGAAQKMSETMLNNLNGQLTLLKSALEGLAIQIGQILMPYIKKLVDRIQEFVQWLQSLDDEQKRQLVHIAAIVAAIGPVLLIVGKVISVLGGLLTFIGGIPAKLAAAKASFAAFSVAVKNVGEAAKLARAGFTGFAGQTSVLGAALGSITAPIAAVIAIIGVLVAAFVTLWNTNEEFRNSIIAIWDGIVSNFNNFCQGIVDRLNALGFNFESIVDVIKAVWEGFCNFLAPIFEGAFNAISIVLNTVFGVITGILDVFIGLFTGNWEQLWQGVQEIFGSLWDGIVAFFGNIVNTVINMCGDFINGVIQWFMQLPTNIANFVSQAWQAVCDWVVNMVNSAIEMGTNFINEVVNFFTQLPYNIGLFIGSALANIAIWVTNMVQKAIEMGTNFINAVVSFFTQLPGRVLQFITSALNNVQAWVTNMVNNARNMGQQFIANVVSFFTQLPGNVANFLSQAIQKVIQWVSDMRAKGGEAIKALIDAVVSGAAAIPGKMMEIGRNIVEGVWQGIQNAVGWFTSQVQNFFSGIVDGVKGALGIGSPSKVFAREVGRWIPPGITQGFEGALPGALKDIQGALDDGVSGITTPDVDVTVGMANKFDGQLQGMRGMWEQYIQWYEGIESRMDATVARMLGHMATMLDMGRRMNAVAYSGGLEYVAYDGFSGRPDRNGSSDVDGGRKDRDGGDTFIFYSNEPITEIQAAKEMRKAKQDMAEGF